MHPGTLRSVASAFAATFLAGSLVLPTHAQNPAPPATSSTDLVIDAHAPTTPFPHFWEQTFGSGRAILSLRESYRDDLRTVKQATDFQSIRFHGIFNDEVGLYDPDRKTKNPGLAAQAANDASVYNFSYVDQIYDGLLAEHVKPLRRTQLHAEEDGLRSQPRCMPSGTSPTSLRPRTTRSGTR